MSPAILRVLRAPLSFLLTVVATLAISVGAAAAVFTLVHAFLLSSLPYEDADELVMVWRSPLEGAAAGERIPLSPGAFSDLQEEARSFEAVAGLIADWATADDLAEPQRVRLMAVVGDVFGLLRIRAARGRVLDAGDGRPGAGAVVVISHGFWQRHFAGDPDVLGRHLTVGGKSKEIVGVLPEDFRLVEGLVAADPQFSQPVDLWFPYELGASRQLRGRHFIHVLGRLAPGVELATARRELAALAGAAAEDFPDTERGYGLVARSLQDEIFGHLRAPLLTLLAATGFVLLIACANLATLLLARARSRHRDVAVRMALGAPRRRIVGESLGGSLLLAGIGGALALLVASGVTEALITLDPLGVFRSYPPRMNLVVVAFTLTVAVVAGLLFGGLPAYGASRIHVATGLRERSAPGGRRARRAFSALVILQVALATTLLIATGLSLRTYVGLLRADVGVEMEGVVRFDLHLPRSPVGEMSRRVAVLDELAEEISALPGVESVGFHYALPFSGVDPSNGFALEGRPRGDGEALSANLGLVNPQYFETLGIPLLRGRGFRDSDTADSPPVALIDERLAARHFGPRDPVGRRLRIASDEMATIVGVVGAVQQDAFETVPRPYVYLPIRQRSYLFTSAAVKTDLADPLAVVDDVRRILGAHGLPISNVSTLRRDHAGAIAPQRFTLLLISSLGAIALFLALVGIYGVMSFAAAQRRREVGIRMAMGADGGRVFRLFVGEGLALSLAGAAGGVVLALGVEGFLATLVHGMETLDPVVFVAVPAAILVTAFLACFLPARAVSRLHPGRVLGSS